MKKQLLFLAIFASISFTALAQSITITSVLPSSIQVGTNLKVNYKYTNAAPGYIYCGLELLNDWFWAATVGSAELNPAPAGTDVTGSFDIFIPNDTALTSSLTGNQNYKIKIELKNAAFNWLAGDYPSQQFNLTPSLGIDNKEISNNDLKSFPNPVVDVLKIDSNEDFSDAEINIVNALGQTVKSKNIKNNSLDVSYLKSGVYFLSLKSKNQNKQLKFIKQ